VCNLWHLRHESKSQTDIYSPCSSCFLFFPQYNQKIED
jgi:hypothetical protein